MYRHALELYLKAIVKPMRPRHELGPLLNTLDTLLVKRTRRGIPARLKADLLIIADLDPKSDAFRYSRKANGERQNIPGEYWVPFDDLREGIEETFDFLEDAWRELGR